MSNPRYVISYDKRILVKTLDMPAKAAPMAERRDFTLLQLEWAADTAKAARTPGAMIWILLCYLAWKTKSTTFPLSNMLLAPYGVDRKTKYRILANLEKAGRIKIQRCHKHAPLVTLLVIPKQTISRTQEKKLPIFGTGPHGTSGKLAMLCRVNGHVVSRKRPSGPLLSIFSLLSL
jgi:hypothetical protein